jgi:hypothetical protein
MQIARLKNSFASIMAFGHMSGMSRSSHRKFIPAVAREIVPMPLTMTAADMGVTFQSCPELYRACHPLFDGRQREEVTSGASVDSVVGSVDSNSVVRAVQPEPVTEPSPAKLFQAVPSWTWEV